MAKKEQPENKAATTTAETKATAETQTTERASRRDARLEKYKQDLRTGGYRVPHIEAALDEQAKTSK